MVPEAKSSQEAWPSAPIPKDVGTLEKPLNREPEPEELIENFITKVGVGYDRNHGPLPILSPTSHTLTITTPSTTPFTLTLPEIYTHHSAHFRTITATLQCAGNRRTAMDAHGLSLPRPRKVWGLPWSSGALLNATWTGLPLSYLLSLLSPHNNNSNSSLIPEGENLADYHICFNSHCAGPTQQDTYYGGSIPLSRALNPSMDVLLAVEMNGSPLTVNHGFPMRIIVPGVCGARSTKWVDEIVIQRGESSSDYQRRDYKILPGWVTRKEEVTDEVWDAERSLEGLGVNSVICSPREGEEIMGSSVVISGYALPEDQCGPVARVEVSADEGRTWRDAELVDRGGKWSWSRWKYEYKGEVTEETRFWSRATDSAGNRQTRWGAGWNLRGVGWAAYGEVGGVKVKRVVEGEPDGRGSPDERIWVRRVSGDADGKDGGDDEGVDRLEKEVGELCLNGEGRGRL